MNAIGSLDLSWTKGYSGSPAHHISLDTVCYKVGRNIKFVGEDGTESFYTTSCDGGISSLAVHSLNGVFAFSEQTVKPKILVVQFPSFLTVTEIEGGAELEYTSLVFSYSDYMASISGTPDYQLIIWRYTDGTKLIAHNVSHEIPTCITFNPGNWRQLSLSTQKEMTVWTIEQNNDKYKLTRRKLNLLKSQLTGLLPLHERNNTVDAALENHASQSHRANDAKKHAKMPLSAIAGLNGLDADKFLDYKMDNERLVPITHCWTPAGDILIGCLEGELLKVEAETNVVTLMTCHQRRELPPIADEEEEDQEEGEIGRSRDPGQKSARASEIQSQSAATGVNKVPGSARPVTVCNPLCGELPKPASDLFTCLALHKRSLFAGGLGGLLCELELVGNHALVVSTSDVGAPITSLSFNASHQTLAIGSTQGSIHLCRTNNLSEYGHGNLQLLFDYHFGNFIAVRSLSSSADCCVTLREYGQLQVWNTVSGKLTSSISIGGQASALGASPLLNLAAVGTMTGHVFFADLRPDQTPRIVHVARLHQHSVRQIAFNATGELVVTTSFDGVLLVLDGRPSKHFEVLGFIATTGIPVDLSTYWSPEDGSTQVAVAYGEGDQEKTLRRATTIVYFCLPKDIAQNIAGNLENSKRQFKSEAVNLMVLNLDQPITAATLVGPGVINAILEKNHNAVAMYVLPKEAPKHVLKSRRQHRRRLSVNPTPERQVSRRVTMIHNPTDIRSRMTRSMSVWRKDKEAVQELVNDLNKTSNVSLETNEALAELHKEFILTSEMTFPGHMLPGGKMRPSHHHKWVASCGGDGYVKIRSIDNKDVEEAMVRAHSLWKGGALDVAFSPDSQHVLSTGFDGTLCCFRFRPSPGHEGDTQDAINAAQTMAGKLQYSHRVEEDSLASMLTWIDQSGDPQSSADGEQQEDDLQRIEREIENAIANNEVYMSRIPKPSSTATWIEVKQYEAMTEEDEAFASTKQELRNEILRMRKKLQKMMKNNEKLAAIEKLSRHEFDLDIDEQKRLQAQCEVEVQKLRDEKEFENLSKMYLAEIIRRECWDDMSVKGRGIVSFHTQLEVNNFPLIDRPREELEELEILKSQRRIELAELAARKVTVDQVLESQLNIALQQKKAAQTKGETCHSSKRKTYEERVEQENVEQETSSQDLSREKSTLSGNQAVELGAETDLFYSQFELCTREQKINEIKFIQDSIYRIKIQYNKDFDEVLKKKEQEISKIKEKNKRISKIMDDLNMPDEVFQPELGPIEKPEMLLVTNDSEVDVEKFLTPEQRKKMEEEMKAEEERREREMRDNWRERGLDMMMGGVLEIKKEDELKKDVPIPIFMQEKQEDDWTDDERKSASEYQRKVKELEEEREKYRKQLELELRKLQTAVQEGSQAFDDAHYQLFLKKVKTELVISQLELKIQRLRFSLLQEEEMANREREINIVLEQKRHEANALSAELIRAKKHLDRFRNEYDTSVADDRAIDKGFKREFSDQTTQHVETLYKQFRKRPRGQKAKIMDSPAYDVSSSNPFSERPSTARQREEAHRALNIAMHELDKAMPETQDPSVWERLCHYRREKVESELLVKQKALTLAEMQAFVHHRQSEDERIKNEIDELEEELSRLHADKHLFVTDLEIQLLLKQGQVEVDQGNFIPDFSSTLLIHRGVVEDLNKNIRLLSDSKIASMIESKDFRKGIIQLEWEHKKMTMQMEDLHNRMRDIINLKVTREIQLYLTNPSEYDANKAQEVLGLEQTIAFQKRHHTDVIKDKKRTVKQIKKSIAQMVEKNDALLAELERLNVSVNERRHIDETSGEVGAADNKTQTYEQILKRRRLVSLAQSQSHEVAVLRAEVERLRMRTFAALVQVEH